MNCEYFRELISCLIDSELSKDEEAALADHLEICPECAAMHAAFSGLSSAIAEDMEEAPVSLCANVMAEIRRAEIIKKNRRKSAIKAVLATAACAVFAIAAGRFGDFKSADTAVTYTTAVHDMAVAPEAETFEVPAENTNNTTFVAAAPMAPMAMEEVSADNSVAEISGFSLRQPAAETEEPLDLMSLYEVLNGAAVEGEVQLPDYPALSLTASHEGVYYSLSFFETENGLYYVDPLDGTLKFTSVNCDILANF